MAMKGLELVALILGFGAIAIHIITSMFRDWLRKRQIARTLAGRNQNDDDEFRKLFLKPTLADIAVRARRILADNLKMSLRGLVPSDRLKEDLNAELAMNPHLFWELEKEFEIKTHVEDLEMHEKTLSKLVTFQDLVEYVEYRITARGTEPPEKEEEKPSLAYRVAIRSIPYLCIGGFLIVVVGIAVKRSVINFGVLVFLSGFAVWGLANGGEMLRGVLKSLRGRSWKEIAARPWPLILLTGIALFFLYVGCILTWGMLKNLSVVK